MFIRLINVYIIIVVLVEQSWEVNYCNNKLLQFNIIINYDSYLMSLNLLK